MPDLWTDQLGYDALRDGPPYLPGKPAPRIARTKSASTAPHRHRLWSFVHRMAAQPGVEAEIILTHLLADFGGVPMAELAVVLAALRAEVDVHLGSHWQSKGPAFYADHELFQRLYDDTYALVDALAERTVGLGSAALVGVLPQHHARGVFLESYLGPHKQEAAPDPVAVSFRALLRFLVLLDLVYGQLRQKGLLTPGLDNLLQGIADKHEELAYLLRQRMEPGSV